MNNLAPGEKMRTPYSLEMQNCYIKNNFSSSKKAVDKQLLWLSKQATKECHNPDSKITLK